MKCLNHSVAAVAVCAYCGRALCADCVQSPMAARLVCSPGCSVALERNERALHLLLEKSAQSARASAFYCYMSSGLSAAAAVGAWFMLPSPFLIYFAGAGSVALLLSGLWYGHSAKQTKL